jgi:hypothetical protein
MSGKHNKKPNNLNKYNAITKLLIALASVITSIGVVLQITFNFILRLLGKS